MEGRKAKGPEYHEMSNVGTLEIYNLQAKFTSE
jgi:hypothetical protein